MMSEPHHSNDYGGFDPQLDFFQVLGEARRHRQHHEAAAAAGARDHSASSSSSALRFKLQKPIGKDQENKKKKKKSSRNKNPRWSWSWRSALDLFFFFKLNWPVQEQPDKSKQSRAMATARPLGHSVSGPLYLAESRNASQRPRHRAYSGPLSARVPYVCLSMDFRSTVTPPPPLYMVT